MEEVNMMLWMKCRHVFSWSTSRAPVWAHYLLSESVLRDKNWPSTEMQNCKSCALFEHMQEENIQKKEKTMKKDYPTVGSEIAWKKMFGNSIDSDAAPRVCCNSSDADEPYISLKQTLLLPATDHTLHTHSQSTRRHKIAANTQKLP